MSQSTLSSLARFQTHDLAGLISLYESNYLRLLKLAPELEQIKGTVVSRVAGALDLYMSVEERFKYTTTIRLTYRFRDGDEYAPEPNARVCVYHDVRCVELLGHCRRKRIRGALHWRSGRMAELERRWEMNRFLLKWLRFCSHQGHLFLACTARPAAVLER
ncbi:MAG TPA: DUF1249 domain-containing protein [Gammaproteobacteria bacterium]|nr:DUF1249 domain-containing protein [Gammaproteobacteria bacterium]